MFRSTSKVLRKDLSPATLFVAQRAIPWDRLCEIFCMEWSIDAVFPSPLDQEFLYTSRATVMFDASRLAASQYLLDGRLSPGASLPRRGSIVVSRIFLALACPRGVLAFPLAGKFKSMRVRGVLLTVARVAARFERELSKES